MKKNKRGFTLAEIIISMSIIGIIAAITIPALLVSTSDKALEAQKKALHARMAQSISQIEDLRVYERSEGTEDKGSSFNFITKALSKVYKLDRICDKTNLSGNGCDFPSEITLPDGSIFKIAENATLSDYTGEDYTLDTEVAGFKTSNGESVVLFYNPKCHGSKTNGFYGGSAASAMCLNMIYDLNGKDGAPNEAGKDVGFATVFFPKDPDITLPVVYGADVTTDFSDYQTAIAACKNQNRSLILPNWVEGMSIAMNKQLTKVADSNYLVTGAGSTSAYKMDVSGLIVSSVSGFTGLKLRCVYNN